MILIEVHSVPPRIKFSIQIFKNYTISCSKWFTQIIRPIPAKLLEVTLTGLVLLIKLVWSRVFSYVLPGSFKGDRLEEESRIYWHLSVECY